MTSESEHVLAVLGGPKHSGTHHGDGRHAFFFPSNFEKTAADDFGEFRRCGASFDPTFCGAALAGLEECLERLLRHEGSRLGERGTECR